MDTINRGKNGETVRDPMGETDHDRRTLTDDSARIDARTMSPEEIQESVMDHADAMDGSSLVNRLLTARYRRQLFPRAEGRVLDVACGTGTNLRYLLSSTNYVGIDISSKMLSRASDRFDRLEPGESLLEMDAQELKFEDNSFDTVISSMSTCMFIDPVRALDEMGRVCKPEGRILLLEHGRSSFGPLVHLQEWRADARYEKTGCRWDQEPIAIVKESSLTIRDTSTGLLGIVTAIEARPD